MYVVILLFRPLQWWQTLIIKYCTRTENSIWGKRNPLDLAVKIISACSKRKMHCWEIIHLTPKFNFLAREEYIWFQTIFVLCLKNVHKRIFLLPIMDHFSACTALIGAKKNVYYKKNWNMKLLNAFEILSISL